MLTQNLEMHTRGVDVKTTSSVLDLRLCGVCVNASSFVSVGFSAWQDMLWLNTALYRTARDMNCES